MNDFILKLVKVLKDERDKSIITLITFFGLLGSAIYLTINNILDKTIGNILISVLMGIGIIIVIIYLIKARHKVQPSNIDSRIDASEIDAIIQNTMQLLEVVLKKSSSMLNPGVPEPIFSCYFTMPEKTRLVSKYFSNQLNDSSKTFDLPKNIISNDLKDYPDQEINGIASVAYITGKPVFFDINDTTNELYKYFENVPNDPLDSGLCNYIYAHPMEVDKYYSVLCIDSSIDLREHGELIIPWRTFLKSLLDIRLNNVSK